jgi:hypothetical protein
MADNVLVTPGSGETVAADDIGGVKWQRVKLGVGADGTASDARPPGDGVATANLLGAAPVLYNGTTGDWQRGNTEGTLLASAARTATTVAANQTNYNHRGVQVCISITVAGTGNLTLQVVGQIGGNGTWTRILASYGPITTTGIYLAELYPGVGAASDEVADRTSGAVPRTWYSQIAHSDGSSWTYSLGYSLIV